MTINLKELYWAAGFLEGEGCVHSNPSRSVSLSASQTQKEPLERLQKILGGSVLGPYKNRGFNGLNTIWVWHITSSKAIQVAMTLFSLFSPKRQGAIKKAIDTWKARGIGSKYRKTCPRGHEYVGENLRIRMVKGRPNRACKTCERERRKEAVCL